MRVLVLLSMAVAASAFGVTRSTISTICTTKSTTSTTSTTSSQTLLFGMPEERTQQSLDNETKANRWKVIRLLSDEDAEDQLSGDELESYKSYHQAIKDDMVKMTEIAKLMMKSVEPPRVKPKGKKQRKRDKWAKKVAVAQAEAALVK